MIRSWQDRGMPFWATRYEALTDNRFWDGGRHYWTGMAVKGREEQDPSNFNCCPNLSLYEDEEVEVDLASLRELRAGLNGLGVTHKRAGEELGVGISHLRQRLYGQRPFTRGQLTALGKMAGYSVKEEAGESGWDLEG